ncbi:MFS transporter [Thermoflavimicrobium daqui]|uniref:MFS transporter n=2 Tax=Thermoflavimicrobium daqui TaxID=2137476 RepID=A0A364K4K7_9BACL|nr:MFS transporter [Thermoflavimicrobium daqui]
MNSFLSTSSILLILGILLIAANLRPSLTSVGPLLGFIQEEMNLSHGIAGLITTLPLLSFAIFSPLAPKISNRYGSEWLLFIGLIILTTGILVRSVPSVTTLFLGTAIVGMAIAICNVLLPGIIKQRFPNQVGLMTATYSTSMGIFASIGSGLSIPLAQVLPFGWKGALAFWAILAIIAILAWLPQISKRIKRSTAKRKTNSTGVWRSLLAWQVSFFMGFQSFAFYVTITWLPEILHDYGLDISTAGWLVSLMGLMGVPSNFLIPILAERRSNQQLWVIIISTLYVLGLAGLLFNHSLSWFILCVIIIGLSQGACISLSYTLIGLRAKNAQQAEQLSGMAQSIGYLLAAMGPFLCGYIHDFTHSWVIPLTITICVCVLMIFFGLGAGRAMYIHSSRDKRVF